MRPKRLLIKNATENNLKGLDLELPHDNFVVVTGLSGSGKSSLAFDTVYAEGQRRYIETFSPYTRQFFDKVKKPAVDLIENVRPAIAIQQRTRITGSRSTVGTLTNINDYLKIVWTNLAEPFCPKCQTKLTSWTAPALARHLVAESIFRNFLICAPIELALNTTGPALSKATKHEVVRLQMLGFSRFLDPVTNTVKSFQDEPIPRVNQARELILVLDRNKGDANDLKRLSDSISQAYSVAKGSCVLFLQNDSSYRRFTATPSCQICGITIPKPRPAFFSFNHPLGACPECKGFGKILRIDRSLCVPDQNLSIRDKAIQCWSSDATKSVFARLVKFCQANEIATNLPWHKLSPEQQELIFSGKTRDYRGVLHWFKALESKIYKMHVRVFLSRYRAQFTCPSCNGTRLKPTALAYKIDRLTLPDLWQMPIGELLGWINQISANLLDKNAPKELAETISVLVSRLEYLASLGLSYLTLDRQARTLSGGETQRVNLASAIGSELVSTQFVLDEPSVGLHSRDTANLIQAMRKLQEKGNSLLVVEHDPDCIAQADHILEIGPGTGSSGGQVVYSDLSSKWSGHELISQTLLGYRNVAALPPTDFISIKNAAVRNLKNISVDIPLGQFVCLTGVSGSGKSTLATEVLKKAFDNRNLPDDLAMPQTFEVSGISEIEQCLLVDQSPLAKSPRANIATFSGIWDSVRQLFSKTEAAAERKLTKSSFSFNVDGGRCPNCEGAGFIKEDMQFLSDVFIRCEVCLGKRFKAKVLEVLWKDHSIDAVLNLSAKDCLKVFISDSSDEHRVLAAAQVLIDLGLGHLTLGHPLSELSGGEAQRLKLVPFIQKSSQGRSLLIFDEPTTGLHATDVGTLINLFRLLNERGHSVVCIEHNLGLIAASDWVIDLGPEGGQAGGAVVQVGTPSDFINSRDSSSYTAQYLSALFSGTKKSREGGRKVRPIALPANNLTIQGAQEHNLKDIDLAIPLNKIVALTGVSGSGKSTIAKDIVYAEGQRRYLDCLSPYARQFIKELKKPEIRNISNIPPTICVYQHTFQPGALSTVGTMSEVYNFLRLLFAKTGIQYCPKHPSQAIVPLEPGAIAAELQQNYSGMVRLLAPIIKLKKGIHRTIFERAITLDISEVRVDGQIAKPSLFLEGLAKTKPHSIDYVVAKFKPQNLDLDLIQAAISNALSLSDGTLVVLADDNEEVFSSLRTCPTCKTGFFRPDPEDLSFHSKRGACPECGGFGKNDKGVICLSCNGGRLTSLAQNLRLRSGQLNLSINEASALKVQDLIKYLSNLKLSATASKIADPVLRELFSKLNTLVSMGLDYLSLNRDCKSLSGGELQRLRLGTAMGSPLTGVLYIFDEPSAGLHPEDTRKVLGHFATLRDKGNSIILIEHDPESILSAEYVIDVGPGGGRDGGQIVYAGSLTGFIDSSDSLTALTLRESGSTVAFSKNKPTEWLSITNGRANNINGLKVEIPLNSMVTVCGVSGAGKSSLVHLILSETISAGNLPGKKFSGPAGSITSPIDITRVLLVDQKPIGKNSRSTPASYLGLWDDIRKLFAGTIEAKSRGWANGFFSYNTGKGRCPECKGQGLIKLEMSFLADAEMICESCNGTRFSDEANSVRYLGLSISEVLNLTFEDAKSIFTNHAKIHAALHQACELGLGYLTIGQGSGTLSGGESQRIKLVSELSGQRRGHTIYLLDEPTTGLHKADVLRLVKVLGDLVSRGNTVILIEHDSDILLRSDYLIELGPGPGEKGGKVVFAGSPSELYGRDTPWGRAVGTVAGRG